MRVLSRPGLLGFGFLNVGVLMVLLGAGCGGFGPGGPSGPIDSTSQDIAAYNQLTTSLAQHSAEFVGKQFSYQEAFGTKLYYLSFPGFDPRLHRFDTVSGAFVHYSFSIGAGDAFNFRVSESLIVTAHNTGGMVAYNAYAAGAPGQLVGSTTLLAPAGAKWWAYSVAGEDVYIVMDNPAAPGTSTALLKWTPRLGGSTPSLFTLEAATGQSRLGEFLDFGVDGDTLVFIEGGRIWRGSLAQKSATWLRNMTQVTGGNVHFDSDGVAFTTATKWYFFQGATMNLIDLGARIHDNPFRISETFKSSHYYYADGNGFTRYGDYMIYIGSAGVFAYDLVNDRVKPILLEPRDAEVRTVYRYPAVTTNGVLFVTGLQSQSGSVGADGPIFRVELAAALK